MSLSILIHPVDENIVNPDQLASDEADLDLHCFQFEV